jgi:hypothetical protein
MLMKPPMGRRARARLLSMLLLLGPAGCAASRCERQGGVYLNNLCYGPARDGGKACRNGSECQYAWCLCPPELSLVGDRENPAMEGTEATGVCPEWPLLSRGVWVCLVSGGRIMRNGLIVD